MAKILLVTPNCDLRGYMGVRLQRAGHFVTRASDFDAALTLIEECTFDVLISSVNDPDSPEMAFVRMAQQIDPDVRIIFVTGFSAILLQRPEHAFCEDESAFQPIHLRRITEAVEHMMAA